LPKFVEHADSVAAAKWAKTVGLSKTVDYGKLAPRVANEVNKSLYEHLRDYPELTKSVNFTGSAQTLNKMVATASYTARLEQAKAWAASQSIKYSDLEIEKIAKRWATTPKTSGEWAFARAPAQNGAYKGFDGVGINEKWGAKAGLVNWDASLKRSVETNFHPPFTDTIKSVMDHELGHKMDTLLNLKADQEIIKLHREWKKMESPEKALSKYAKTNIDEFIAEAWAEARNNPAPRQIADNVMKVIDARYREKFSAK
jgi:hypothetical protein